MFYKKGKIISLLLSGLMSVAHAAPNFQILQQEAEAMQASANDLQRARQDIVILISFSMPEESLKHWIADASRVGAVIELRGLVDQSFQGTMKEVMSLSNHQGAAWRINPKDFEQYHIATVPAVVVFNPKNSTQFDSVQGNGTLEAALDRMIDEGELKSRAKEILSLLHENDV